jgi:hypothetical protein
MVYGHVDDIPAEVRRPVRRRPERRPPAGAQEVTARQAQPGQADARRIAVRTVGVSRQARFERRHEARVGHAKQFQALWRQQPTHPALRREPSVTLGYRVRQQGERRVTSVGQEGVDEDEPQQSAGKPGGNAGQDHPGVAVPGQHDIGEPLGLDGRNDVLHVRVESDAGAHQVRPVPQAGQGGREHVVPTPPQLVGDSAPAPSAMPGAVDQHVTGHFSPSAHVPGAPIGRREA